MSTPPQEPNAGDPQQWPPPQDVTPPVAPPQFQPPGPVPPQFGQPNPGAMQPPAYSQQPGYPTGPQQPGYGPPPYGAQPGYPPPAGPYNPYAPYGGAPAGYGASGPLVPWGPRVGAFLLDRLLMFPFVIVAVIVFAATTTAGTYDPNTGLTTGGSVSGVGVVVALLFYLGAFVFELYQLYRQGTTGQTIGKKIVGIRVIREADGRYTGFGMAFVRWLAHILDSLACYLGWLWPLWDDKKQTFADKLCGTVVVKA